MMVRNFACRKAFKEFTWKRLLPFKKDIWEPVKCFVGRLCFITFTLCEKLSFPNCKVTYLIYICFFGFLLFKYILKLKFALLHTKRQYEYECFCVHQKPRSYFLSTVILPVISHQFCIPSINKNDLFSRI